jgi:cell division septum initiation protein DivIVA
LATDLNTAAEALRRFVAQLDGFRAVGDALSQIASLDQAQRESKARLDAAQENEQRVLDDIAVRRGKAEAECTVAKANAQTAHAHANSVFRNAEQSAEQMLSETHDRILAAEVAANGVLAALGERIQAAEQQLADTLGKAEAAEKRAIAAEASLAKVRAKLGD